MPNGSWPSLDAPIDPVFQFEAHQNQEIQKLSNIVVAAAYQLINVVREPFLSLVDIACGSLLTAALNTTNELNVAEVLREAGPDGTHIDEIARRCQANSEKLGRCLRLLAAHHIFREVHPNVFALNRISSLLDTGIPHQKLQEDQLNKFITHTKTGDISGYIGHFAEDVAKASLYHLDDVRAGGEPHNLAQTPFQKAFRTDGNLFNWMHDPAHQYEFTRHNACIRATARWDTSETLVHGFDWGTLPPDSLVVDVGGGTGRPALALAKAFSHLKILVQDREPVVQRGLEYWKDSCSEDPTTGRVSFAVHDFFEPQPILGARVYFARVVFHDWDDIHVIQILKHLRSAASPESRLVVADYITPFSISASIPQAGSVKTSTSTFDIPTPLLSNLGKASANTYYVDIAMQLLLNGKERTLLQHIHVVTEAGWRVVEVRPVVNSNFGFIIAEPA
ncbi:S-adenosyl-L-methionine-dependent methyltransferase [Macrolepiota fuliginosa MF-IS2]|uniref:S-adenosyl-L-methionine-dependent methyltransferase n=1 Tax=Macrolepiota fuliginosa MF-IS2 TaxID=1400762 RepID=A0A9P5XEZ6_9AGAR|nr:S-adenosyl-L-methionine-dependent methyltransferase [Macrolepiota fuliginosa MF-IS2]